MTAGRPAGALLEPLNEAGMVGAADHDRAPADLLEVTFQTKVRIAGGEELGIDRTVWSVTDRAPFAHSLMLEHVRATLGSVASEAGLIGIEQRRATATVNRAFVRGMAVCAIHFPLRDGMVA